MPNILEIIVRAKDEFSATFRDASQRISEQRAKLQEISRDWQAFGQSMRSAGFAMAGAGAAILAPLGLMIRETISYGSALDRMAKITGMASDRFAALAYAASQEHASMESLAIGLRFLSKNMYEAASGSEEMTKMFQMLGIEIMDASGRLRPANEVLLEIADRMRALESPTERTALAIQLFGRSGQELVPFLIQGSTEIMKMAEEARKLGVALGPEITANAERMGDVMESFSMVMKGLGYTIAELILPYLEPFVKWLTSTVSKIIEFIREHKTLILALTAIAGGIAGLLLVGGTFLIFIGQAVQAVITLAGAFTMLKAAMLSPAALIAAGLVFAGLVILAKKTYDDIRKMAAEVIVPKPEDVKAKMNIFADSIKEMMATAGRKAGEEGAESFGQVFAEKAEETGEDAGRALNISMAESIQETAPIVTKTIANEMREVSEEVRWGLELLKQDQENYWSWVHETWLSEYEYQVSVAKRVAESHSRISEELTEHQKAVLAEQERIAQQMGEAAERISPGLYITKAPGGMPAGELYEQAVQAWYAKGGFKQYLGPIITTYQKGGIAWRPTLAMLGERGPEKVTPLGRELPSQIIVNIQFPSVATFEDWRRADPAILREVTLKKLLPILRELSKLGMKIE